MKIKNDILSNEVPTYSLDTIDRKILSVLVENTNISYTELGERISLSAPATHERVKRLKRSGIIKQNVALLDPYLIGKTLLAFVHINTQGWGKTPQLMKISTFPEVEEIHSIAGDTSILLKVRTKDAHALEAFLSTIYNIPGVISTRTNVVLSTYLERPIQAETTERWL